MGNKPSTHEPSFREKVEEEIARRMMIQREVQMSVNIAKARDNIQYFGSAYAVFVGGVTIAKLSGKKVPPVAGVPIVVGGLLLGNIFDFAYGNKLARVSKEAEHIMENERSRLVPMKQAPVARFYSEDEKKDMFDSATAVGRLWPSSLFSRSFVPSAVDSDKTKK